MQKFENGKPVEGRVIVDVSEPLGYGWLRFHYVGLTRRGDHVVETNEGRTTVLKDEHVRPARRTIDEIAEDWRCCKKVSATALRKDAILKAFKEYGVEVEE